MLRSHSPSVVNSPGSLGRLVSAWALQIAAVERTNRPFVIARRSDDHQSSSNERRHPRSKSRLEWHRLVAPVVQVGEITSHEFALSRPRRGFESRWGHQPNLTPRRSRSEPEGRRTSYTPKFAAITGVPRCMTTGSSTAGAQTFGVLRTSFSTGGYRSTTRAEGGPIEGCDIECPGLAPSTPLTVPVVCPDSPRPVKALLIGNVRTGTRRDRVACTRCPYVSSQPSHR